MRYFIPALFVACLFLGACGSEGDCQNPPNNNGTDSSETSTDNNQESTENSTEETDSSGNATDDDSERVGTSATSCGDPIQGLEPVDCTIHGDTDAFCVYGNHCYCNRDAGFQCEAPLMDDWDECEPGSTCVPIEAQ